MLLVKMSRLGRIGHMPAHAWNTDRDHTSLDRKVQVLKWCLCFSGCSGAEVPKPFAESLFRDSCFMCAPSWGGVCSITVADKDVQRMSAGYVASCSHLGYQPWCSFLFLDPQWSRSPSETSSEHSLPLFPCNGPTVFKAAWERGEAVLSCVLMQFSNTALSVDLSSPEAPEPHLLLFV